MSKKSWFVIILTLAIMLVLCLSRFVAGFDQSVHDTILAPAWGGFMGLIAAITSNPFYQSYAFQIGAVTGIVFAAVVGLILWPHIKGPTQKATTTLQDKIRTTPTSIPTVATATPVTTTVAAPTVPSPPEVEEESG